METYYGKLAKTQGRSRTKWADGFKRVVGFACYRNAQIRHMGMSILDNELLQANKETK